MAKQKPLTTPDHSVKGMPGGVPFIIGNEAAERFSFYGMRAILTVFMTKYLVDAAGNDATYTDEKAKEIYHLFVAIAYFTPMIGALLSDIFLGKYRTILYISLLYCAGHGCLALMDLGPYLHEQGAGGWDMEPFLFSGLFLIALGAGGIKPCVSAHVGDQFGHGNKHLMTQIFNWFYFSINVGAAVSQILTPWLLEHYGPPLAFGLPGVLMAIATFVFWLGRHRFIHIPPAGPKKFFRETFSKDGLRALLNLSPIFLLFVPMFWAIFDQTGSAWVIQADQMNREFGIYWLPSQVQFVNPVLILVGIPVFTYVIYPFVGKFVKVTPLRKIGAGLVLTSASFGVSALVEVDIQAQQAGIAQSMYSDLATATLSGDVDYEPGDDAPSDEGELQAARAEHRAGLAKAAVTAAESSAWESGELIAAIGVGPAEVIPTVPEDRLANLISSAKARQIHEALSITYTEDEVASASAMRRVLDAAIAAGWSLEQLAEYEITMRVLTNALPDSALAELIDGEDIARTYALLALSLEDPESRTTDLASAVKAARVSWDEEQVAPYLETMPNIAWQFLAYLILTSAEILVSIVCLEFAYSQSPPKMKSLVMGVYFLGVSLGNFFVGLVNGAIGRIEASTGTNPLEGANYYWFFGGLMLAVAVIFIVWSPFYRGRTYIQGDEEEHTMEAEAEAEGTEHG
ncbi:MAG: POT family MFS transporter [Planctomycetota bacterium]